AGAAGLEDQRHGRQCVLAEGIRLGHRCPRGGRLRALVHGLQVHRRRRNLPDVPARGNGRRVGVRRNRGPVTGRRTSALNRRRSADWPPVLFGAAWHTRQSKNSTRSGSPRPRSTAPRTPATGATQPRGRSILIFAAVTAFRWLLRIRRK